jgi:hypothetical protein
MTPQIRVTGETWLWFTLFVCVAAGTLAIVP